MAKIEYVPEKKERVVTEVVTPEHYNFSLSEDEAKALYAVLTKVGGDPFLSERKYTDSIFKPLKEIMWRKVPMEDVGRCTNKTSIRFRENEYL